jgi:hypothetical protein
MLPRPEDGGTSDYREDGLVDPGDLNRWYGHRSEVFPGNSDPTDRYLPDRATGCSYEGNDFPGISALPGTVCIVDLDFHAEVIDVCNGGVVRRSSDWTVQCEGTL